MVNPVGVAAGALGGTVLMVVVLAGGSGVGDATPPPGGCGVSPAAASTPGGGDSGKPAQETAELTAKQLAVAKTIVGVGKGMNITERGTAIALGTAMQESTLDPSRTDGYGTGIFQQQGEFYAHVDKMDPAAASQAFYEMLLTRVPNYNDPAVGFAAAAQTVQASGAGARWYARWEAWATALAAMLYSGIDPVGNGGAAQQTGAVHCTPGGGSGSVPVQLQGTRVHLPPESGHGGVVVTAPNEAAAKAIAAGLSYLGTPYAWGGGSPNGPTKGVRDGGVADAHGDYAKTGFDCAGLTQYAYAQAQITLTRPASTQLTNATATASWNDAKPGDLLFWGASPHHVAIYLGEHGGQHLMLEAPQSGDVVKVSSVRTGGDFQTTAARPAP